MDPLHSFRDDDSFYYSINEETPIAAESIESIGWFLYQFVDQIIKELGLLKDMNWVVEKIFFEDCNDHFVFTSNWAG